MRVFWNLGLKPWAVVDAYCDTILGDGALLERLQGGPAGFNTVN